ncbi:membrane protein [Nitrospira sp. KM1]|uniref:DUF423 domain-containing protein n=1 Tax=Nitrospira sp. KM1 TaxID=1936990 RepID=UPI0013A767EB|nr:DUF423 domain-containing protein [Nitrospira sp. KM1]BCA57044.1 membrane protein [Nitrospira sp. KM1]
MHGRSSASQFLFLGCLFAAGAVGAGAFGAHSLKHVLDASMLTVFETAVRYQMYHALALCIVSWAMDRYADPRLSSVGWLFTAGIIGFSGSLYAVSLLEIRWLGAVTPLGGVAFITGWILLAWRVRQPRGNMQ